MFIQYVSSLLCPLQGAHTKVPLKAPRLVTTVVMVTAVSCGRCSVGQACLLTSSRGGGLRKKWQVGVKKFFKQEHGSFVIKITASLFPLHLGLTSSLSMFLPWLFSSVPQPPPGPCSLKPLLSNIQSCFCICFRPLPISPHCKVAISFPEKWHNCVLLFGAASYHCTGNVTIPPHALLQAAWV